MVAFVSDSFDGNVGDDIQVYNPSWARVTGITGATTIGSRLSARGTGAFYRSDAPAPNADYEVSGDLYINSAVSGPNLAILGRVSATAATYYQANLISGTGIRLARTINGSSVTIETAPYTVVVGNTLRLKLVMEAGNISVYADDSLVIGPIADTLITAPGYVGFRLINAGSSQLQLDSIRGDTLGAPPNATRLAWTEQGEAASISATVRAALLASWIEQGEGSTANVLARVLSSANWAEQDEATQISAALQAPLVASWAEQGETNDTRVIVAQPAIAASMSLGWNEQGDVSAVGASALARLASAWIEQGDAASGQILISTPARLSVNWAEQGDSFSLRLAIENEGEIDAFLVPDSRRVVFEGSKRVVSFEGSKRVVSFDGSIRTVRFE